MQFFQLQVPQTPGRGLYLTLRGTSEGRISLFFFQGIDDWISDINEDERRSQSRIRLERSTSPSSSPGLPASERSCRNGLRTQSDISHEYPEIVRPDQSIRSQTV